MPTKPKPGPRKSAVSVHPQAGIVAGQGSLPERVWGSVGLTLNLGDYQSARVDSGMSSDVREGESVDDAYSRVFEYAVAQVSSQAAAIREAFNPESAPRTSKKAAARSR